MNIVAILIPIALMMGLSGLLTFFWALRAGQFDDPDGSAIRILLDEDELGLSLGATRRQKAMSEAAEYRE